MVEAEACEIGDRRRRFRFISFGYFFQRRSATTRRLAGLSSIVARVERGEGQASGIA
jgi:hypothetical protein